MPVALQRARVLVPKREQFRGTRGQRELAVLGGAWLLPPTTPGTTPGGPSVVMGE